LRFIEGGRNDGWKEAKGHGSNKGAGILFG